MAHGIWAYCRVSTTKDEQELSLGEQERWAESYAAGLGEALVVFRERASARSTVGRPEFQRMMASVQGLPASQRPKQIVVTSLDRLSRDMTDTLVVTRTLRSLKVGLFIRDMGLIKAETFGDRAALVGRSMGGEAENEARSNRARASWDRRRREGKPTSNKSPYGLQLRNECDVEAPESGVWVRRAFEWYLSGIGAHTIARRFQGNAPPHVVWTNRVGPDGAPVTRSRHPVWEYNRILKMLRQSRYRGTIVKPEVFDRAQQLLADKPRWRQSRKGEYPLSGAVKCGGCGRSFHGRSSSGVRNKRLADGTIATYKYKRIRYYGCIVCNVIINADEMEEWFRHDVNRVAANEKLLREWVIGHRPSADLNELRRELVGLEHRTSETYIETMRSRVWDLALEGPHSAVDLEAQLARIDRKRIDSQRRLLELQQILGRRDGEKRTLEQAGRLLAGFWQTFDRAPYEAKRELMARLCAALGGVTATKGGLRWSRNSLGSPSISA